MITQLSQEQHHTVFLCTHNLVEAQHLCSRVAVLEHGCLVALGTPAELARRYGRTQRLQIEVAPDGEPAAASVLRTTLGSVPLTQEGSTFSVAGADRETIPDLVAALVAAGVRVYRVAPLEPSLEDVYFALQGEMEEPS